MPNQAMQGMPLPPLAPQPQARMPQPTQWQASPTRMPSPAFLASGANPRPVPATVRGVSADPPRVSKFVLPSPEALGVRTSLKTPATAAPTLQVDWNQIQARMERLRVLRYEKDRQAGGVRVMLLLPTSNPERGQPVTAQAETEAAAIVMALEAAEAWMQKR
jgi:hypothetical protein